MIEVDSWQRGADPGIDLPRMSRQGGGNWRLSARAGKVRHCTAYRPTAVPSMQCSDYFLGAAAEVEESYGIPV